MSYISAEMKASIDLSESRVGSTDDEATWDMAASLGLSRQLTTGAVLVELVEAGHDIVVCTADLGRPTQVIGFGRRYPDRYFNFGIAERNMIGAAAGLATTGHIAVISNYSFFLALMGIENIRNDICYPGLNVRMIGTHSGLAMGFYGTSHHCNEDIGALRAIAGLTLMAPCDGNAIRAAFEQTIAHDGPIYFRAGRGREKPVYDAPPAWTHRWLEHVARRPACDGARDRQSRVREPRRGRPAGGRRHRARRRRHVLDRADRSRRDPPARHEARRRHHRRGAQPQLGLRLGGCRGHRRGRPRRAARAHRRAGRIFAARAADASVPALRARCRRRGGRRCAKRSR